MQGFAVSPFPDTLMFARRIYTLAGIYGLIVLLPQYLLEGRIGRDTPPPITHPEYFYGMIGVALAWQVAFLIVSRDPFRYRPLMAAAVLEKLSFGIAAVVLYAQGRTSGPVLAFGFIDLLLAVLFALAYFSAKPQAGAAGR